tara:strand:- start:939 stop:2381 length:1443 start_codon:yes stop_codon:yes gene_type:complete
MPVVRKLYGPPGTGKTTTLIRLVEEEVKKGTPLHEIAYLSFTKAAAEVVKDRMRATSKDMRWFKTIHAACLKLNGMTGNVINYHDKRDFSDTGKFYISDIEDELEKGFNPAMRAWHYSLHTGIPEHKVIAGMPLNPCFRAYDAFKDAWNAYKAAKFKCDFMDMLTDYSGAPLPCKVVFLDEAQDLSNLQWGIFEKLIAGAERVYLAGDDDQAIYGFIGGSEYGFLEYPADEEEVLDTSFRVPATIGRRADKVIHKVKHRKEKFVNWSKNKGSYETLNLDTMMIPWHKYVAEYKDIMVLARHRKVAREFSDSLNYIAMPHSFDKHGIQDWRETKFAHTYFLLREGGTCSPSKAANLVKAAGYDDSKIRSIARHKKVTFDDIPFDDFPFRGPRYDTIKLMVRQKGFEALNTKPKIKISTMHGAKGDEAELVIIVPDCNSIVKDNINTPNELRLSYVAMTRAQKKVIVMVPRSGTYMTHFLGG